MVLRGYVDAASALAAHRDGVRALLRRHLDDQLRYWRRHLPLSAQAALQAAPIGGTEAIAEDLVEGAFVQLSADAGAIREAEKFARYAQQIRGRLGPAVSERSEQIERLLVRYGELRRGMQPPMMGFATANLADLREQLERLLGSGFAGRWSTERLGHIDRYLQAAQRRLERMLLDPGKDQLKQLEITPFDQAMQRLRQSGVSEAQLDPLRWAIEEYRVSVFAQELGTAIPVSAKRLHRLVKQIESAR